jgi:hypothetical protein
LAKVHTDPNQHSLGTRSPSPRAGPAKKKTETESERLAKEKGMEHQRENRRLRKEVEDLKASVSGKEQEVAKMRNDSGGGKAGEIAKDQKKEEKRKAELKELKQLRKEKKDGEWEAARASRDRREDGDREEYKQAFDEGMEFQKQGGHYIGGERGRANEEEHSLGEEEKEKGAEEEGSGDEVNEGGEGSKKKGRRSVSTPSGHQGHAGTRSNGGRKESSPK